MTMHELPALVVDQVESYLVRLAGIPLNWVDHARPFGVDNQELKPQMIECCWLLLTGMVGGCFPSPSKDCEANATTTLPRRTPWQNPHCYYLKKMMRSVNSQASRVLSRA